MQELQDQISTLEERVTSLMRDKTLLMDRCEMSMVASASHANRERSARMENAKLKKQMEIMKKQMEEMKETAEDTSRKFDVLRGKVAKYKDR